MPCSVHGVHAVAGNRAVSLVLGIAWKMREQVLCTMCKLRQHAKMMQKSAGMALDGRYMVHVSRRNTGESPWRSLRLAGFDAIAPFNGVSSPQSPASAACAVIMRTPRRRQCGHDPIPFASALLPAVFP
jgi:hypothetical protein